MTDAEAVRRRFRPPFSLSPSSFSIVNSRVGENLQDPDLLRGEPDGDPLVGLDQLVHGSGVDEVEGGVCRGGKGAAGNVGDAMKKKKKSRSPRGCSCAQGEHVGEKSHRKLYSVNW
jgi:hypothetical protein